ncbi:MAG TPA: hypothetical protein VGN26_00205 [Armatimonadota bacterium]|jgi:hypothetical protein
MVLHGRGLALALGLVGWCLVASVAMGAEDRFEGKHFAGRGDARYLGLLETARRMFAPDPQYQNLSMLYMPAWNGFVEGPTWDAWWVQNSYGTTYCALPFYREPYTTFLLNAQNLWFSQMGDGERKGANDWVAPDGCLCDCARPGWIMYRQGDGRTAIHDWGVEFTAAGLLMQCELLLISRDEGAISHYLPLLERCAGFLETRRDPKTSLYLAGPAGNLLAPSFAGWRRPDGSYGQAYLAGLSVTTIAALDRLSELESLAGRAKQARVYHQRRNASRKALARLATPEGYLINSLDPDGVRHGVFGAKQHGYFESSPNHDAIAFRVVGDSEARRIYRKMASIPELRPYHFILPNYPSYDDMYEKPEGLWGYGTWVNGGHWSTCEARMMLAYSRLGRFEDARASMEHLLTFARDFRMDNPLTQRGSQVYQPGEKVNLCYDTFGPAAGLLRGLFEYLYGAKELTLIPHIPRGITELRQKDPIRFGTKLLWLSTYGRGRITGVRVNGREWRRFTPSRVTLPYSGTPDRARVVLLLGGASVPPAEGDRLPPVDVLSGGDAVTRGGAGGPLARFVAGMEAAGLGGSYEAAHARLALAAEQAASERRSLVAAGKLNPLTGDREEAAQRSYEEASRRLRDGLVAQLGTYASSSHPDRQRIGGIWRRAQVGGP